MTTNSVSEEKSATLFIVFISVVATLGGFLFGYDSGVINGTVEGLQTAFKSKTIGTGFSVASMLLGSAIGAFFAGWASDSFGRRNMLIVAAVLFIISAWGSGIAGDSVSFIAFRILGGLAVGGASVMAPAYISEIAPAHIRGRLTSIQQVAIITGLFCAFLNNYFLAKLTGSSLEPFWLGLETWRWMFWMELIPAFVFLIMLFFIPKSPRYLIMQKEEASANRVLRRIYGEAGASSKLADIRHSLASDHKPSLYDVMQKGQLFRGVIWVGIGLAVLQQFVGINIIFYYGAVLWQSVGFSESDALLINVLSGGLSIASVLFTLTFIEKIGRKPFLVFGSVGMFICLAVIAVTFSTGGIIDGKLSLSGSMGVAALLAANAYVVCFNLSWGPVMWVMLGEIFPNQIRGSGLAVSGAAQWIANFAITMTFPIFLATIGLSAAYSIYAFFAFVSIFFVLRYVRETTGIELEEMPG
jgi:SP family sugar:H+ symporter-like MFS transporter